MLQRLSKQCVQALTKEQWDVEGGDDG
jgi:hypothetical protein